MYICRLDNYIYGHYFRVVTDDVTQYGRSYGVYFIANAHGKSKRLNSSLIGHSLFRVVKYAGFGRTCNHFKSEWAQCVHNTVKCRPLIGRAISEIRTSVSAAPMVAPGAQMVE